MIRDGAPYNPFRLFTGLFLPDWILRSPISDGAKSCWGILARYAGGTGRAWPKIERLAADLAREERQVKRYLAELKAAKLIRVHRRGPGQSSIYEFIWNERFMKAKTGPITPDEGDDLSTDSQQPPPAGGSGERKSKKTGHKRHPSGVTDVTSRVSPMSLVNNLEVPLESSDYPVIFDPEENQENSIQNPLCVSPVPEGTQTAPKADTPPPLAVARGAAPQKHKTTERPRQRKRTEREQEAMSLWRKAKR